VSRQRTDDGNLSAVKTLQSQTLSARITFVSHAPTLAVRRAAFPLDEPLVDGESERIAGIGWMPPSAQHVWCGPEKRTRQTAKALGLEPAISLELADINYGMWSGKEIDEIQTSDPEGLADWLTNPSASPHGGHSLVQSIARVESWMANQMSAGHTLAVTHPAVIRAAILCALHAPPETFWRVEIAPLSITDLRYSGQFWTVRSTGCPLSHG
jgi:broad specificity phosphatase PhoE